MLGYTVSLALHDLFVLSLEEIKVQNKGIVSDSDSQPDEETSGQIREGRRELGCRRDEEPEQKLVVMGRQHGRGGQLMKVKRVQE